MIDQRMIDMLRGPQPSPLLQQPPPDPQQLQRLAGDVVPLPINPGPNAGPAPGGVAPVLQAYQSKAPNVSFMPPSTYENYFKRLLDTIYLNRK